jgi:WD domain, G-beta repeat
MHFIDPLFITEIALPRITQLTITWLTSGIVVGLVVGGILSIRLKPRRLRILGAMIGAVISQFTFGLYLELNRFSGMLPPINYLLSGLSLFFSLPLYPSSMGGSLSARYAAIALLGTLPGVIIGSHIFPRLHRQKRWQYSLFSLGIAYLVACSVLIVPAIAPSAHFAKAKAEQFPFLGTLIGHAKEVTSLAFHPNGKWLISGGTDNAIRYWQLDTGNLLKTISSDLAALSISPIWQWLERNFKTILSRNVGTR